MAAFSAATRTAVASISTPTAWDAPSSTAPMDSTPLPQPMSSIRHPEVTYFSSMARQRRVVSWVPVPKAMPGSSRIITSPGSREQLSQEGQMTMCSPTRRGW